MLRIIIASVVVLCALGSADARLYESPDDWRRLDTRYDWRPTSTVKAKPAQVRKQVRSVKRKSVVRSVAKPSAKVVAKPSAKPAAGAPRTITGYLSSIGQKSDGCRSGPSAVACLVPVLAAKVKAIMADCGSRLTSAVAPRGYRSNHPIGRAADLVGAPACILSHLKGWPGGLSTDYNTAPGGKHYHVSYNPGGQEWGVRFAHRSGRSYANRRGYKGHRYAYHQRYRPVVYVRAF